MALHSQSIGHRQHIPQERFLEDCGLTLQKILEPLVDFGPVHDVPERLNELAPVVLVVQVIRVLPNIQDHQNPEHRVDVRIVLLDLHYDGPVRLFTERECCPTRALGAGRRLRK